MKLTVVCDKKYISDYKKIGAQAFIFALKGYSSGYNNELTIDEIKELVNDNKDIEIFIAANKNIFNDELDNLKELLLELDKLDIKGVLFYDISILSIKNELDLKLPLVWNQTHMVTNYNTCNYFYEKKVEYAYLGKEITLEEINEIKDNTKMKLFTFVLGYPDASYTRRSLLSNYFKSIDKNREKNVYEIINNEDKYIIEEEEKGNCIYKGNIVNGAYLLDKLNSDYIVLDSHFIDNELFSKVLSLFVKLNNKYDENIVKEIDSLVGTYKGFFDTKTIYKVKK